MRTLMVILIAVVVFAAALWWSKRPVTEVIGGGGVSRPLNPCGEGHQSPHPVVCIDGSFTKVTPERVHAKSYEWINFYIAGSSGDLDVQFTGVTPLHHATHLGTQESHHFKIQAKKVEKSTDWIKYKVVERESGKEIDPEVMIDP
jgi:hypothetical protein